MFDPFCYKIKTQLNYRAQSSPAMKLELLPFHASCYRYIQLPYLLSFMTG